MKEKSSFMKRTKSMLAVDFRRMFTSSLFYIMVGIAFVMPILILVMTTMMDGSVSVNPQTGEETIIEGFKNVWQIIGSVSGNSSSDAGSMQMDITSMCNINMMFFIIAVFVCVFIAEDFRSGYVKNLFTVRSKKDDYVISKTITSFVAGACMIVAFFLGSMIGGAIAGLSFELDGVNAFNIIMCLLSKVFLVSLFASIYILASVIAKQRLWLSLILSLGIGMLFFMTIPLISPLNSTIINAVLCLIGGGLFATGIGVGSYYVLKKTSLV